jgi:hypothetical protein
MVLSFRLRNRDYLTPQMVTAAASGIAQKGLWPLLNDPHVDRQLPHANGCKVLTSIVYRRITLSVE